MRRVLDLFTGFAAGMIFVLLITLAALHNASVLKDCVRGGTAYDPETAEVFQGYECQDGLVMLVPTHLVSPKRLVPPGMEMGI